MPPSRLPKAWQPQTTPYVGGCNDAAAPAGVSDVSGSALFDSGDVDMDATDKDVRLLLTHGTRDAESRPLLRFPRFTTRHVGKGGADDDGDGQSCFRGLPGHLALE